MELLNEMEDLKKKRCQKTTRQQYMLYMEMLESSDAFRSGKINPTNQSEVERLWEKLVEQLNCSGGPQKDASGWKKVNTYTYFVVSISHCVLRRFKI